MTTRLINVFRDVYKNQDSQWLNITTRPSTLSDVCDKMGNVLHGRGFDVIVPLDTVGETTVPLLSIIENLPFSIYSKGQLSPSVDSKDRVIFVCGTITDRIIEIVNILSKNTVVSAIVSLVDIGMDTGYPQISLYTIADLEN